MSSGNSYDRTPKFRSGNEEGQHEILFDLAIRSAKIYKKQVLIVSCCTAKDRKLWSLHSDIYICSNILETGFNHLFIIQFCEYKFTKMKNSWHQSTVNLQCLIQG